MKRRVKVEMLRTEEAGKIATRVKVKTPLKYDYCNFCNAKTDTIRVFSTNMNIHMCLVICRSCLKEINREGAMLFISIDNEKSS